MSRSIHKWTNDELDYLREIAKGKYMFEIAELMSIKFGYKFRKTQIKSAKVKHKIKNGMKTRYLKVLSLGTKVFQ